MLPDMGKRVLGSIVNRRPIASEIALALILIAYRRVVQVT